MINVYIHISPATAVRAGESLSGTQCLKLVQGHIDELNPLQRETLADLLPTNSEKNPLHGAKSMFFEDFLVLLNDLRKKKEDDLIQEKKHKAERLNNIFEYAQKLLDFDLENIVVRLSGTAKNWVIDYPTFPLSGYPEENFRRELTRLETELQKAEQVGDMEIQKTITDRMRPLILALEKKHQAVLRTKEIAKAKTAELKKQAEETKQKEEQAKAQLNEAIATWIETYGTQSQKERFEAGVLPEAELWNGIRNQMLTPFDDFPKFKKLTFNRLVRELEENGVADIPEAPSDVNFVSKTCDSLFDTQWEQLKEMRAAIDHNPNYLFETRVHKGQIYFEDEWITIHRIYSIKVSINWHGRELSRVFEMCD